MLLGTVAYAAVRPANDEAAKQLLQRSGRVKIKNSRGGDALVGMRGMVPGDSAAGTVTIGNASKKLRARFFLGLSKLVEAQGTGGGRLSNGLVLTVKRLAANRRPQLVYSGPLRQMPLLELGVFRPREARIYRFSVLFPEGGPAVDGDRLPGCLYESAVLLVRAPRALGFVAFSAPSPTAADTPPGERTAGLDLLAQPVLALEHVHGPVGELHSLLPGDDTHAVVVADDPVAWRCPDGPRSYRHPYLAETLRFPGGGGDLASRKAGSRGPGCRRCRLAPRR